ncbi:MAG: PqqD family peptide modification chaperone [Anaerolineales bacterium]|nr:PqqD family peptide modification chaperone [Anaerolineales bacterium]
MNDFEKFGEGVWEKRFKREEHIVSRAIVGETLLVPIRGQLADMQKIFSLNPVADLIWEHLDGEMPLYEIRDGVMSEFEVDEKEANSDLLEFIAELVQADLVHEMAS